jgi:hypothetical protein
MSRKDRTYDKPHYKLGLVHAAAAARDIVLTGTATADAERVLPRDLIDVDGQIREVVASLTIEEYEFTQTLVRKVGTKKIRSIVDVYRIDFEGADIWMKIKVEQDAEGDYVVIISFHEWDDSRPI